MTTPNFARSASASPLILGHRGARGEYLENGPTGFDWACQLSYHGLDGVEFDVQLTADGHLIVFHDDNLLRLGGRQSRIDQLTLNEIRRITIGSEPILVLEDLLTYSSSNRSSISSANPMSSSKCDSDQPSSLFHSMKHFRHIELEVKTHQRTCYPHLIAALESSLLGSDLGQLPIVLTSFDTTLLAYLQRHTGLSAIPRGLLVEAPSMIKTLANTAAVLGCCQVGVYHPFITSQLISQCQRLDLSVSAWTVNEVNIAQKLIDMGVSVLITDYPTLFLQALKGAILN